MKQHTIAFSLLIILLISITLMGAIYHNPQNHNPPSPKTENGPPITNSEAIQTDIDYYKTNFGEKLAENNMTATLYLSRSFHAYGESGGSFEILNVANITKGGYSPWTVYNTTDPDSYSYPPVYGDMTYSYVWEVKVRDSYSIPPDGYAFIDAYTGKIIPMTFL
jgi:hypothetical protein